MAAAMDFYQDAIIKLLHDKPPNLINDVRRFTMIYFTALSTPPTLLRQRTFAMLHLVETLKNEPEFRSEINRILEEIYFCVSIFLEQQNAEYMNELAVDPFPCEKMAKDTIPFCLQLRPKNIYSAVKALYKLKETFGGEVSDCFQQEMVKRMEDSPALIIQWVDLLGFSEFRKNLFDDFVASFMIKRMDIKALVRDTNDARKAVEFLDKTLDNRIRNEECFNKLTAEFTRVAISRKISKLIKEYSVDVLASCPNAIRLKRIYNFIYTMGQRLNERTRIAFECMKDITNLTYNDTITCLRVWEQEEPYAGIACARYLGLPDESFARIGDAYANGWDNQKIDEKIAGFSREMDSQPYIASFLLDDKTLVSLVDDLEKLNSAMKKLSEAEFVAFDVEAAFVFSSIFGTQDAALLQLAFDDCVLLIDLFQLAQTVPEEHLRVFFEMFLGTSVKRIGFDVKCDLNFLLNAFPWINDYLYNNQPTFYCVQKFANNVSTSTTYAKIFPEFPKADKISLEICCEKWLEIKVDKEIRGSNWLQRPLTEEQMRYAAADAKYTLDSFKFIQKTLHDQNLDDNMDGLIVTPDVMYKPKKKGPRGKKEPLEEVMTNVADKVAQMREMYHDLEKPENITVVLDTNYLSIAPILRRFGYKVFDQREAENGDKMSREEVVQLLSKYLRDRISEESIRFFYLLTDNHFVTMYEAEADIGGAKIIPCSLDETESSIICSIIEATKTVFDCSNISLRCTKCGKEQMVLDLPSDVFRVVYIHFAKQKGFLHKLKLTEDNFDSILDRLKNDKIVEVIDNWMIHTFDEDAFVKFSLNDEICAEFFCKNPDPDGVSYDEKKKYKCNTRLFENLGERETVNFCVECFEFF